MEPISALLMILAVVLVYIPSFKSNTSKPTQPFILKTTGMILFLISIWVLETNSTIYPKLLISISIIPFIFKQIKGYTNYKLHSSSTN